jgi:hypothetical protein
MNDMTRDARHPEPTIRETSEERVWETPGYLVVDTAPLRWVTERVFEPDGPVV